MKLSLPVATLSLLLGALLPLSAHADIDSALQAYHQQQYDIAFKEFSQLAAQGDNRAKSFQAMMTLRGQGTPRDIEAGAQLARECAVGGEPTCYAMFGELNLPGKGLPVDLLQARAWTRKAIEGGDLRAGLVLWQAYQLDAANQYLINGKPDAQKYQLLARRSIAQRSEQTEAIDALAGAAATGYQPARLALATVLINQSGANTSRQVRLLLEEQEPSALPDDFRKYLALVQQMEALGPTRASPQLIADAIPAVTVAVTNTATLAGTRNAAKCNDFRLMAIRDVSAVGNATWLPLKQPLVADTYPLSGSWKEQWRVFYCGANRNMTLRFDVDGLGGATYRIIP
jgi:TPR repeat protein